MPGSIPSSTLEKFITFGDLLRFLRRRVGLTQLELGIAVGYSNTQISRLEQNERLPDIPTLEARFVSALELEEEPQALARLLDLAAHVRREDAPAAGLSPYKGLNYFDETESDLFVGRESLTSRLIERVLALAHQGGHTTARFLAIVGASGSGKSSLVRAGLISALRWNRASTDWLIHLFTPTAHPLECLAAALTHDTGSVMAISTLMDDIRRDPRSLQIFVRQKHGIDRGSRLLLVIDQFEELFALCHSEEERFAFVANLLTAASEPDGSVIVVITLRADFYAQCANYPRLREALAQSQEYIGAMNEAELRRAIEEPAQRGRWELEPGLVDLLLHDVGHEPGALPLLSHALFETWQRRRGRMLTLSGYASAGGVRGAIAETAETLFVDRFTPEQRAVARRVFLRLTELSDEMSMADTRRRATFNELILRPEEASTTHDVLKALADARLIVTNEDSAEVAHEALIREWPTLRRWLEENREGLRLHRHLTEAAQEWEEADYMPDMLYRSARLAQAREWASSHEDEMNELESRFLAASIDSSEREAAERELQRQRELEAARKLALAEKERAETERQRAQEQLGAARQLRKRSIYLANAFIAAFIMALTAVFFAWQARQSAAAAETQQRVAFSRELAAAAISNLEVDPERSLLLAREAVLVTYSVDRTWTAEAEEALRYALQASGGELTLSGHSDWVEGVAFHPDRIRLATASHDGTMRVWNLQDGTSLSIFTGAEKGQLGIAFHPDGTFLAAPGPRGMAKVWDPLTGKEILTLSGHTDWVNAVAFSPEGTRIATASDDKTAKIWDTASGRELLTLRGHTGTIGWVVFNPDGTQVATASTDKTAKLWDIATGDELMTFAGHGSWVNCVAFSPDGNYLATASGDHSAKIWQISTGREKLTLYGHEAAFARVAYGLDGKLLATSSIDGRAKIWDVVTGQELLTLTGHTQAVIGVAFSPDGTRVATTSWDGTAKLWDLLSNQELLTITTPGIADWYLTLAQSRLTRSLSPEECKKYLHREQCPAAP